MPIETSLNPNVLIFQLRLVELICGILWTSLISVFLPTLTCAGSVRLSLCLTAGKCKTNLCLTCTCKDLYFTCSHPQIILIMELVRGEIGVSFPFCGQSATLNNSESFFLMGLKGSQSPCALSFPPLLRLGLCGH